MDATLTITMSATGQLSVNGPIENKLVAFGMLEMAKEAIIEYHKAQQQRVQPADAAALRLIQTPS